MKAKTKAEFFKAHIGRACDYDHVAGVQCVDLIKFYTDECFNVPGQSWGNARDYWYNTPSALLKLCTKIKNTKSFVPQRGDICIFDDASKMYGHICIADNKGADGTPNDTHYFYSYDQNYNNKKACTLTRHSYSYFLGVLRPKYKCTTVALNVRSGAGTSYPVVYTLESNELVKVVSITNGWAKLDDGNYCSANYLD